VLQFNDAAASSNNTLLQRCILVGFCFQMSHCQEWAACQPPDQMSASQTCFFSTPDFRVGKEAVAFCWLSDSHECQWAGVHCVLEEEEEAGTISQMQISKFVGFCNSQECRRLFFSLLSSLHAMNAAKMKLFGVKVNSAQSWLQQSCRNHARQASSTVTFGNDSTGPQLAW